MPDGSQGLVGSGAVSTARYDDYSSARTLEAALGLAPLTTHDGYARPINDAFFPNAPTAVTSLVSSVPNVKVGEGIPFNYVVAPARASGANAVGLYLGSTPSMSSSIQTLPAAAEGGTVVFASGGLAPGTYSAWMLGDGGSTTLAGPANILVSP